MITIIVPASCTGRGYRSTIMFPSQWFWFDNVRINNPVHSASILCFFVNHNHFIKIIINSLVFLIFPVQFFNGRLEQVFVASFIYGVYICDLIFITISISANMVTGAGHGVSACLRSRLWPGVTVHNTATLIFSRPPAILKFSILLSTLKRYKC